MALARKGGQTGQSLTMFPIHLGRDGCAIVQPAFAGGLDWYEGYDARHAADGPEGRLVSQFSFDTDWESWEMHPAGDELVLCLSGRIALRQMGGDGLEAAELMLDAGAYAINPRGVWHTANVPEPATVLFITPGTGTLHRPR